MSANDNAPATRGQFITFEYVLAGALALVCVLATITWNSRTDAVDQKFSKIDGKFERIDQRFEKLDEKLDKLILSVNTIQSTMATKDDLIKLSNRVTDAEKDIARLEYQFDQFEKKQ
ncbi:hypothetical protein [Pseudoalteromonas piscicida]|uniref:hypothetical protein n=1 Tax=Pseudoalteromonas piscicida TaxID=43662 RepID=UPI001FD2C4A6|nr:hypothetical protein [Pseudoalteromonas piscicida]